MARHPSDLVDACIELGHGIPTPAYYLCPSCILLRPANRRVDFISECFVSASDIGMLLFQGPKIAPAVDELADNNGPAFLEVLEGICRLISCKEYGADIGSNASKG